MSTLGHGLVEVTKCYLVTLFVVYLVSATNCYLITLLVVHLGL